MDERRAAVGCSAGRGKAAPDKRAETTRAPHRPRIVSACLKMMTTARPRFAPG
ncbi:MAG TPA: hypothetical protein VF656_01285 [Pyrinomonadaceae bacterium]